MSWGEGYFLLGAFPLLFPIPSLVDGLSHGVHLDSAALDVHTPDLILQGDANRAPVCVNHKRKHYE